MKYSKKVFSVLMSLAMIMSLIHPVTNIHAASENILTDKAYTTTTLHSSYPSHAVDGNTDSYWDAGSYLDSPWITFDLGGTYLIDSFNVVNYHATNDRYYHYDIYVSIDGENFSKVVEKRTTDKAASSGDTLILETPAYATHVKFVGVYNSANTGFHFNELRAYGTSVSSIDEVQLAKQELAGYITQNYYQSDYSYQSWETYEAALKAAKEVVDNESATKQEVTDAKTALLAAIEGLTAGNPDKKEEGTFRVGTFNVWAPNPNHPDTKAIANMFNRIELDYIGLQELDKNNGRDNRDVLGLIETDLEEVSKKEYTSIYKDSIEYLDGHYGIGQISSTEVLETSNGFFTKEANEEQRSWMRMLVKVGDVEVAIYNVHLTHISTSSVKAQQMNINELKTLLDNDPCPYKIVTGDFNAYGDTMNPFLDNYDLVNGYDGLWYRSCDSYGKNGDGKATKDSTEAIDNIIISKNIELVNSRLVHHEGLSDHYMLYADLKFESAQKDLQDLVDSCNYKEGEYTAESYAPYKEALQNAKNLLAETDYSSIQNELFKAASQLRKAIAGLDSELRDNLALKKDVYIKDIEGGYKEDGTLVYEFFDPQNVTDGIVDSSLMNGNRTSMNSTEGNYLQIDLEKVYDFNGITIDYYPAGKELEVLVSKDGETWTSVKTIVVENPDLGKYGQISVELDEMVTGRYVKFVQPVIKIPGYSYSYKWGVCEIKILGNAADLTKINSLLDKINKIDTSLYTEESLEVLNNEVTSANTLLETSLSTLEINEAYKQLKAAYDALELLESEDDDVESINVASQKNGGVADADNVTVVGGDKAFLNNNVLKDAWIASSSATPVSAKVDFNKKYEVDLVRVIFKEQASTDKVLGFTVSYVDENGNTKELYKGTSYNEDNSTATLNLGHKFYSEYEPSSPVVMKGLKVTVTSNTTGDAVAIAEIQAFGKESKTLENEKNLALGAKITATQQLNTDYGAHVAVDGDNTSTYSYWHSGKGLPQSLTIDLGEACTISKMVAYPFNGDGRYYLYNIEISDDGETWEKVADREETFGTVASFSGETYAFKPYLTARYVKVNCTYNSNGSEEFHMREFEVYGISNAKNVALNKNVSSTNADLGSSPDVITDGNYNNYWDGGSASKENPQSFTIDLDSAYFIDSMKAYPYTDGSRRYEYDIEVSVDGKEWTKVADRTETHGEAIAFVGETYKFDSPVYGRFVRVNMYHNTANPSVHMREFEVYGTIDPDYEAPSYDPSDDNNLAYGKPVHSHLNTNSLSAVVDGFNETTCSGAFAPAYFDIDLQENVELSDVEIKFPLKNGRYYYFSVYGSKDGTNYDRLYQERSKALPTDALYEIDLSHLQDNTYRIVRIYVELVSDAKNSVLSEVRVHGTPTGENTDKLLVDYTLQDGKDKDMNVVETILDMESYEDSKYSAPITEAEVIENVYGIIDRIIGNEYRDWFTFDVVEDSSKTKDWYSVEYDTSSNKIVIKGNEGLSLSSGLNYYLKNYCHVAVSEQSVNGTMPDNIVKVDGKITKENQVEVRYAFNYCTLNYTFSYADSKEFQREYDWMALNGVNCVLDLAGQEAVWIMFLMNFGYTYDEAKDWIAGGTYYAWQFMDNMEVIGGPVADEWVKGRLEMARENQRWKVSLGMQTVLQGYAGMIPNNFGEYQEDVEILEQGTWCNLPRPDMIRTDGELYDQYAELFYEAQHWAFGNTSNYYAVDPFHEGGIRPEDLTDEVIASNVLESLLKYDDEAVWMVQAWWANPTNGLLNGMGDYRKDHVLILDLMGLNSVYNTPYWQQTSYYNGATVLEEDEFNSTSWVWCLLENYGGNPGMDGRAEEAVKRIQYAYENAEHMKGIGIISEATYDNPFIYDLIFDMAWVSVEELQATTPKEFLTKWKNTWVYSRYGVESENAKEAWDILIETLYSGSSSPSQVILSTNPKLNTYGSRYSFSKVEKALQLLFEDYELLSQSECYRYDLTELMRQIVSNYATELCGDLSAAYNSGDIEAFKAKKEEFLGAFDLLNKVCATQQDLLIGEWVGSAADWATDTGADDFAYDAMTINAKTLITVWAPTTYLGTYAFRHYEGIIKDVYKPIWESYLDGLEETLVDGVATTKTINYTNACMEWIYTDWDKQVQSDANPDGYIRYADNSVENMRNVTAEVLSKVIYIDPINVGNVAYEKSVTTNAERPDSPGAPGGGYASNVTDGLSETYWDGITWEVEEGSEPYVIIDLEDTYVIDKINVLNYVAGTRYYLYDVYTSIDGEEWNKVASREEAHGTVPSPAAGDDYIYESDKPVARYVKLVGLYNSSNEGFHVKEIRVYGNEVKAADYTALDKAIEDAEKLTAADYKDFTAVEAALKAAKELARDLSELDQATVDATTKALTDAVASLEEKDAVIVIPTDQMNVSAGSEQQNNPTEGKAEYAIDGNPDTLWHTDWNGAPREDHWFMVEFDELKEINGMQILQRSGAYPNGQILKYDLYGRISEDSEWVLIVDDGELTTSNDWQNVTFDPVEVKYVKLVSLESTSDVSLEFSAIAEIRFTETGKEVEAVADYSAVNEAIAKAENYSAEMYNGYELVEEAIAAVVRGLRVSEQARVNEMAAAIEAAIAALTLKDADYAKVEEALDKVPSDLSIYTQESVAKLQAAIDVVVEGYKADKQDEVDAMAASIEDAIKALVLKDADYAKVEEALGKVPSDLSIYTEESAVKLQEAIEAVVEGLDITKQAEVDAYATSIEEAITALELKAADYSKVEEAITKAEALVKENYKDFADVEAAIEAVVEGFDITKQAEVDGYAKAIEEAIAALELKDADYSEVEAIIEIVKGLDKDDYENFEAVEEAIKAVVEGLDITKQDEVDAMADAISKAVANLKVKEDSDVEPTPEPKPEPDEEEEEDKPVKPEVPGEDDGEDDNVNTSDSTQVFAFITMMAIAVIAFFTSRKQKED